MKPQKRCVYCRCLFDPYPGRYRVQKSCRKKRCQKQRRRTTDRKYYEANRYDRDYKRKQRQSWREKNGKDYMRAYRKKHKSYEEKNREKQRLRDRKKKNLVKSDLWKSLYSGKLVRIRILESSCKVQLMRLLPE